MKASNKVQVFLFFAILLLVGAWKLHFLPSSIYSTFPISTESFKKLCHYRRDQGVCAIFQCGRSFYSTSIYKIKVPLERNFSYLIEADVLFRNKKEICPGKDGQKDRYFDLHNIMPAPQ